MTTGVNNTAIGSNAQVPNMYTNSNQIKIGNDSIQYAYVKVPWTTTSDRRLKSNILNSNLGLNFITMVRPVSYYRNNNEGHITEYGFIAQEIEEVLNKSGVENCGMIGKDDKGYYYMRYNDLFAPIVKAIQELKEKNDKLEKDNEKLAINNENLRSEVEELKSMNEKIVKLEQKLNELTSVQITSISQSNK